MQSFPIKFNLSSNQDDSSDTISIEEEVLESSPKKKIKLGENKRSLEIGGKRGDSNNFVQFENVGFRTNGSFVVKVKPTAAKFYGWKSPLTNL